MDWRKLFKKELESDATTDPKELTQLAKTAMIFQRKQESEVTHDTSSIPKELLKWFRCYKEEGMTNTEALEEACEVVSWEINGAADDENGSDS